MRFIEGVTPASQRRKVPEGKKEQTNEDFQLTDGTTIDEAERKRRIKEKAAKYEKGETGPGEVGEKC